MDRSKDKGNKKEYRQQFWTMKRDQKADAPLFTWAVSRSKAPTRRAAAKPRVGLAEVTGLPHYQKRSAEICRRAGSGFKQLFQWDRYLMLMLTSFTRRRGTGSGKEVRLNSIAIGVIPVMVLLAGRSPVRGIFAIFLAIVLVVLGLMLLVSLVARSRDRKTLG